MVAAANGIRPVQSRVATRKPATMKVKKTMFAVVTYHAGELDERLSFHEMFFDRQDAERRVEYLTTRFEPSFGFTYVIREVSIEADVPASVTLHRNYIEHMRPENVAARRKKHEALERRRERDRLRRAS